MNEGMLHYWQAQAAAMAVIQDYFEGL